VIVYIHGFNSSPASAKAQLLQKRLTALGRANEFTAPALPHSPAAAASMLDKHVSSYRDACLVGSSLGGYYATWLAERHRLRAVLVNPAVRPYTLLVQAVGRQKNFYTGEEYDFTSRYIEELRALEVEKLTPELYFLLVKTGDEVLDYRQAVERYDGGRKLVIAGGDHGFSDFSAYLDAVLEFCGGAERARR